MNKTLLTLLAVIALALTPAFQATAESKGKTLTLAGKGCCAKCCLKESDTCQNVLTVEKDGKKPNTISCRTRSAKASTARFARQ